MHDPKLGCILQSALTDTINRFKRRCVIRNIKWKDHVNA